MSTPHAGHFLPAEQILLDERFLAWAQGEGDGSAAAWIELLRRTSSEQEEELAAALLTFQAIRREESSVVGASEQRARLLERLEKEPVRVPGVHPAGKKRYLIPLLAFVSLGILSALFLLWSSNSTRNTITGNGTLTQLSDGTTVALRSTSTITYADGFEKEPVREVWVKGEAQFDVTHQKNNQPFIVHTRHFDVEVTGTRFIVNNQSEDASVLLQEGAVNLIFPNGEHTQMKPGDFFSLKATKVISTQANVSITPAVLERHIVFDNTPFSQVAKEIERRYEVQVKILDPVLNDKLITGILPNNDLTVLLNALENSMDCRIIRDHPFIYIKSSF